MAGSAKNAGPHVRKTYSLGSTDASTPDYRRVGSPVTECYDRVPHTPQTIPNKLQGIDRLKLRRGPID